MKLVGSALWLAAVLVLAATTARADVRVDQLQAEGWNLLQRQSWLEAQARFAQALAKDPNDAHAWSGFGYALLKRGKLREARGAFERANHFEPHAFAWAGVGHACVDLAARAFVPIDERQALLDRAGAAFVEAHALQPGMTSALHGMLTLHLLSRLPGAPHVSLAAVTLLALGFLLCALLVRLARTPRALLRADARALFTGVLVPYAFTRALVLAAFSLSPRWLEPRVPPIFTVLAGHDSPILQAVAERWDANLYVAVSLLGYQLAPLFEGGWSLVGQLPLLPVLYRFSMHALGDAYWSALVLPHAALLVAACAMFLLVRASDGPVLARRATWALLLVPGALFGSALYAEPIALAALIAAYAHARQGRPWLSVLAGMLAGMARINALAAVPMLALDALVRALQGKRWALLAALGPPLGLVVFMLYTHFGLGDAFAYFHELRQHRFTNQGAAPALRDIGLLLDAAWHGRRASIADHNAIGFLALGCLIAYGWAGVDLLRRKRFAEASCVLFGVFLAIGSNLVSAPRYLWLLFPACISFALLAERPLARYAGWAFLSALLFLEASAFAAFYFVT